MIFNSLSRLVSPSYTLPRTPCVKVSLSEYGSSDLRSPWNAKRNVAAAAGCANDTTASAAANRAVLNFMCSPFPTDAMHAHRARELVVLFLGEPVEQDLIVGALRELHLFRYAPCQRLLVQRDEAIILLLTDLVGLRDHRVAF